MLPFLFSLSLSLSLAPNAHATPSGVNPHESLLVVEWQARHANDLNELQAHPDYDAHMSIQPMRTRSGGSRFLGDQWVDAKWTPVYVSRYEDLKTPADVRYALLDLIARSGGDYAEGLPKLWMAENDVRAKALMLDLVKRLEPKDAEILFKLAFSETDPIILEAFYRNLPRHEDLVTDEWIQSGLQSTDINVLDMAIRSAGWMEIKIAYPLIEQHLYSESPKIRLRSLRALERIDQTRTKSLPQVISLTNDTDFKVSRAANQITSEN